MTKAERRKLAKAARRLASEFAEGRGPEITNNGGWCNCAAAMIVRRAFGWSEWDLLEDCRWMIAGGLDEGAILTGATDRESYVPGAVVFPLLWIADELESRHD